MPPSPGLLDDTGDDGGVAISDETRISGWNGDDETAETVSPVSAQRPETLLSSHRPPSPDAQDGSWTARRQNRHQVAAMISNFSTSYNVVNISLVLPILRTLLFLSTSTTTVSSEIPNATHFEKNQDAIAAVASSLLGGMMVGQILGGIVGDWIGADRALQAVMLLQVVASLGSASLSSFTPTTTPTLSLSRMGSDAAAASSSALFWSLAVWRFFLGIGAGGVYPLAAVLSAENQEQQQQPQQHGQGNPPSQPSPSSDVRRLQQHCTKEEEENDVDENDASNHQNDSEDPKDTSLHRVVLTFSMQGLGFFAVPLVAVSLLYTITDLDVIWRIMLGLGSLPGLILLVWTQSNPFSCCFTAATRSRQQLHQAIPMEEESNDLGIAVQASYSDCDDALAMDSSCTPSREHMIHGSHIQADENDFAYDRHPTQNNSIPLEQSRSWWDSVRQEENLCQKLLGTAATWFLFDVLFYGNTLFQPIVIEAAFGAKREHSDSLRLLQQTAVDSLVLTSVALPGYAVAGMLLGKKKAWCYCGIEQSPRFVMLQGFAAMSVLYLVIGAGWNELRNYPELLVLLYSLTFFFANYGPNTTTFVLPSLVYSPECRSTFNGLSAAAGKLGALTGASLFEPAAHAFGDATVMLLCAGIAGVSLIATKCFVPNSLNGGGDGPDGSSTAQEGVASSVAHTTLPNIHVQNEANSNNTIV